MIKHLLPVLAAALVVQSAKAQITITAADVPVAGDTIRYSRVTAIGSSINYSATGPNMTWDFSNLTPYTQVLDTYKTAAQVNASYAVTISPTAYGILVADQLDLGAGAPVSITNVYTFFNKKNSPDRFVAEAFAAKISGIPTPINYSNEDEIYFFPLDYGDHDTSSYRFAYSLGPVGSFVVNGTRTTDVDGWGTIKTPYYTTPKDVLRVKSETIEVDSITFSGNTTVLPRHNIDYQWLPNGEHFPALWITTVVTGSTEAPNNIRYRDYNRPGLGVPSTGGNPSVEAISTYPNPATNTVNINIPQNWQEYFVEVFDVQGKLLTSAANKPQVDVSAYTPGNYIIRVTSGSSLGYTVFTK